MAWLTDLGNNLGLGDLDRSRNEFRDVDQNNFNLPGMQGRQGRLLGAANGFLDRSAPQAADSDLRGYQVQTLDRLGRQANGLDSMSAMQLQQGQDQMAQQQRAYAAGMTGGNAAMGQRMAMQNASRGSQGLAQQQAMAGIAERQAANMAIGQIAGAARGQDIGLNQFNAGAQLQQTGMNDAAYQAMLAQELQNAALQQQGMMGYEAQRGNRFNGVMSQPTVGEYALGGLVGGGMAIGKAYAGGGVPAGGG